MKPGLFHSFSNIARRSSSESSNAARSFTGWAKPLSDVFSVSRSASKPARSCGLLLGGDRPVVERRAPVGGALVHGDRLDVVEDGRDDLHAARRRADDRDALAGEVDRRPPATARCGAARRGSRRARARRGGTAPRAHRSRRSRNRARISLPSPAVTTQVADVSSHTADGDRRVEAHVAPEVEAVDHVVEVALGLRLPGEVLLPLPVVEQLLREEVAVGVALGVEPRARVAVPVPGAADAAAGLEQQHREARFAGAVQLVDAGDAGADDEDVDSAATADSAGSMVVAGPRRICTDRLV